MAIAVKGCRIMGGNQTTITVRRRCESCGHQDKSFVEMRRPRHGQRLEFRFRCPVCGSKTDCLIIGS